MAAGDPGTRTAPAFTAAANQRAIVLHLIDASGDLWSERLPVPVAATAASIEAWADSYADATQASLYGITDEQIRMGAKTRTNANTDQRNSIKQGVNMLWYNITLNNSETTRLVAPVLADMVGDSDIPDTELTSPLIQIQIAQAALTTGYQAQTMQYTERRERKNNPRVGG